MAKEKKTKKPVLVLIDSHAIIHRAYHALPDLMTASGEPGGALYGLSSMLIKLITELNPEYVVAAYDLAGPTHRHEIYEDYKGTRAKTDTALIDQIEASRGIFAAFHIPIYEAPGFEADDVIGTLATDLKKDYKVIIASGDMDTLQLVSGNDVTVFTLRKGIKDTILYNEKAVVDRFGFKPKRIIDYKGFAGDQSDNIIGIRGIGEKTATKIIQAFGGLEDIYKALHKDEEKFKKKAEITDRVFNLLKDNQEEAEFSKVLATIRLDTPVTFVAEDAHWKEKFVTEDAVKLFSKLGFRSLVPRIERLLKTNGNGSENKESLKEENAESSPLEKEARVALWLLHSDTTNPSTEDVLNIAGAVDVEKAQVFLLADLKKAKLLDVFETIEKPLIPVIDSLNGNGIQIDLPYLKKLSKEYHTELNILAKKIYKVAGEEFNLNSPKQLAEVLFAKLDIKSSKQKKTATGRISTKESELLKFKDEHPVIEDVLAYRELQKLLSTYIDAIPPLLDKDGRLRTTFVQTGTTTGRFSSRDPNLQNIPIRSELGRRVRNAFVAKKGSVLMSFDYSQIELRLAAFLSGDEKLKDIFVKGEDVHQAVAAEVFGVAPENVEREMRRRAKIINFGILYGMGVNALRVQLGTDREEAQEFMNQYFETFSELAEYLTKTKASATRLGYTTTHFGRKRFFPGLKSRLPFIRASAERMAINAPIQGTQADIIKLAMIRIDKILEKDFKNEVKMVLQIHDELMFEVSEKRADELAAVVIDCMESVLPIKAMDGIPLVVSGVRGVNWGEMKPL